MASQFHKAGLFGGDMRPGDRWNEQGYFENIALHRAIRQRYGTNWAAGDMPEEREGWHEFVEEALVSEGYTGGPWFFKVGAFYWKTFASFNPVYVKAWRDREQILDSYKRCGMLSRYQQSEIATIVDRQHEAMKSIPGLDIHI